MGKILIVALAVCLGPAACDAGQPPSVSSAVEPTRTGPEIIAPDELSKLQHAMVYKLIASIYLRTPELEGTIERVIPRKGGPIYVPVAIVRPSVVDEKKSELVEALTLTAHRLSSTPKDPGEAKLALHAFEIHFGPHDTTSSSVEIVPQLVVLTPVSEAQRHKDILKAREVTLRDAILKAGYMCKQVTHHESKPVRHDQVPLYLVACGANMTYHIAEYPDTYHIEPQTEAAYRRAPGR